MNSGRTMRLTGWDGEERDLVVYPNVIELWVNGRREAAFTSEEWARVVEFVGIRGFAQEPDVETEETG